jgi:hypothetical protein
MTASFSYNNTAILLLHVGAVIARASDRVDWPPEVDAKYNNDDDRHSITNFVL